MVAGSAPVSLEAGCAGVLNGETDRELVEDVFTPVDNGD